MQGLTEIRWHARGGQGAVTAAKMVAEVALGQKKYFQAFPEYGPERSGAPIVAFTRISDAPIQIYAGVEHPQIVVVLDPTPVEHRRRHQGRARRRHRAGQYRPAAGAAARQVPHRGPPPVTPSPPPRSPPRPSAGPSPTRRWSGALTRITGLFPLESVVEFLRADFGKKFPPKVVEGNIDAITRSYEEVQGE